MEAAAYAERIALDDVEPRLKRRGYTLIREPSRDQLPDFLSGFKPDAIALGPSPSLIIEVKQRRSKGSDHQIRKIQELLRGHDDWRLDVVYVTSFGVPLEQVDRVSIDKTVEDVRRLALSDNRAALLLGWAVLEAVARSIEPSLADRSMSTSSIAELLVSMGHISQEDGSRIRVLGHMRNKIAHGQIDTTPSGEEVEFLADRAASLMSQQH